LVLTRLHVVDDFGKTTEDVCRERSRTERFEERLEVICRLDLDGGSSHSLSRSFNGVCM
jgi:hypothetical protein